jgi:hypothetical protein
MDTAAFLRGNHEAIVDAAFASIRRNRLQHYEASAPEVVRARVETLFDRLVETVERRDLAPMTTSASSLAGERFSAGFPLSEVQAAMNALEEAAWACIEASADPDELGEALALVTSAVGAGKDALARAYVSLATRSQAPSLDVRALFAGTGA